MDQFEITAKQKGRIGEALLSGHAGYATQILEPWITDVVLQDHPDSASDAVRVTHDHRVETYYVRHDGEHMSWTPDCLFTAWVARSFGPLQSSDERRIDLPVEIKTGSYAEPERNQRKVMELLATEEDLIPVLATVRLDELPDTFGVALRTVEK